MHRGLWDEIRACGVCRLLAPLPKPAWDDLYSAFDEFTTFVSANPQYAQPFNRVAKDWQIESGLRLEYSGYFSPYFRDLTSQAGKDNKVIIQFCAPYYRYLWKSHPELIQLEPFRQLANGMMAAIGSATVAYLPFVDALKGINPDLAAGLLPRERMPSVAIRLIRYEPDSWFYTNPHNDKSAVTFIMDTDEPEDEPALVFAPRRTDGSPPLLSAFKPARKAKGESLAFFGAAPRQAGFDWFEPATHAVRPLSVPMTRHVAIFFWLLPGVDLADFDTATEYVDDLGLARPAKSEGAGVMR